jgi:hypothetical protein
VHCALNGGSEGRNWSGVVWLGQASLTQGLPCNMMSALQAAGVKALALACTNLSI